MLLWSMNKSISDWPGLLWLPAISFLHNYTIIQDRLLLIMRTLKLLAEACQAGRNYHTGSYAATW